MRMSRIMPFLGSALALMAGVPMAAAGAATLANLSVSDPIERASLNPHHKRMRRSVMNLGVTPMRPWDEARAAGAQERRKAAAAYQFARLQEAAMARVKAAA